MEIVSEPSQTWEGTFGCERCGTVFRASTEDLKLEGFKTSGYFFTGTAVVEERFFVECPNDNQCLFVKEDEVPVLLQDRLRADRRKRGY